MDGSSAKPTKPYSAYISPVQSAKKEHTLRCLGAFDEQRWFDVARKSIRYGAWVHSMSNGGLMWHERVPP